MTQRDRGIAAALSALLLVLALALVIPGSSTGPGSALVNLSPSTSPSVDPAAGNPPVYREGVVGLPSSINPLTARTQADRDLSRLIFSGLVARGPGSTYVPDLAASWTVDSTGRTWTFRLRPDATWQDGQPLTADDVVFTVGLLKDPAYRGALANSWSEVSVVKLDPTTVQFSLATPIAGFLEDALVGIMPEHLLGLTPITSLADSPFSSNPVGSGPYRLVSVDDVSAELVPTDRSAPSPSIASAPRPSASGGPGASAAAGGPGASAAAGAAGGQASEPLPAIELRFFADSGSLAGAYRAGSLDAASGLSPSDATALASLAGSRLLGDPSTTLSSVAFNLRAGAPGGAPLAPAAVRRALLQALDRPAMVTSVLDGLGNVADSPIPPSSWAFDPKASAPVPSNPAAAATALKAAGWTKGSTGWLAPKAKAAFAFDLLSPDQASNPIAWAAAEAITGQWRNFGLAVTHVALDPTDFVARLGAGSFVAALVDVNVGLDPDLYPLFASSQAVSGGANLTGIQDSSLDALLVAARLPGTTTARAAAYGRLQAALVANPPMLPLFFQDDPIVLGPRVQGPSIRTLADLSDRYWDVLTWRLADGR
ncbi:MAG: ABC transporter substrate-binding protein [Candidatus Limnocylindrales bacterium]